MTDEVIVLGAAALLFAVAAVIAAARFLRDRAYWAGYVDGAKAEDDRASWWYQRGVEDAKALAEDAEYRELDY